MKTKTNTKQNGNTKQKTRACKGAGKGNGKPAGRTPTRTVQKEPTPAKRKENRKGIKEYITDDGRELTKSEAEKLNHQYVEIMESGDLKKMLDIHFIFPKALVVDLMKREKQKNRRG